MHAVIAWILAFMVTNAPPGRHIYYPDAVETKEETEARYASIAKDLAEVTFDSNEQPIFPGNNGRLETAGLLASIALYEGGGYRKDVDLGKGKHARGDGGRSVCLMQIFVGAGKTAEGYSADDLLADRKNCFRAALHMAQYSFRACQTAPLGERLRVYTSGRCDRGSGASYARVMTGVNWFKGHMPEFTDAEAGAQPLLAQD